MYIARDARYGFTLIEIMVTLAIIALIGAISVPYLRGKNPANERKVVFNKLNALTHMAAQAAVVSSKTHRVVYDAEQALFYIEQESDKKDAKGEAVYEFAKKLGAGRTVKWPKNLEIKNFVIEGFDELSRRTGATTKVWFYIIPNGLTQDVIINLIDTKDVRGGRPQTAGLVLNPFSAHFEVYDTFQK